MEAAPSLGGIAGAGTLHLQQRQLRLPQWTPAAKAKATLKRWLNDETLLECKIAGVCILLLRKSVLTDSEDAAAPAKCRGPVTAMTKVPPEQRPIAN